LVVCCHPCFNASYGCQLPLQLGLQESRSSS